MAQHVRVEVLDDIDGSVAADTVKFGLDGVDYEIDLSDDNAANLRDELERYVAAARRNGGRKVRAGLGERRAARPGTSQFATAPIDRKRNKRIRAWAEKNGYTVSGRGRLSNEVVEAYETAQQAPEPEPAPEPAPKRKRATQKKTT
ncbi:Lsr2 family protein [Saccharothrix sp. AJ9571]|nr:Lsr2 family protein [Saccharothrix sp. AJ9571]